MKTQNLPIPVNVPLMVIAPQAVRTKFRAARNGRVTGEQTGTLPTVRNIKDCTAINTQPTNARQRRHEVRKAAAIARAASEMDALRNAGRIVLGRAGSMSSRAPRDGSKAPKSPRYLTQAEADTARLYAGIKARVGALPVSKVMPRFKPTGVLAKAKPTRGGVPEFGKGPRPRIERLATP